LIVQTVSVKDKDGKTIEGLTAKDFIVSEDGQPQEISFVEFQRIDATPGGPRPVQSAVSPPASATTQPAPAATAVQPVVQNQIASSQPGAIRYRHRRLGVLYFDL